MMIIFEVNTMLYMKNKGKSYVQQKNISIRS